MSTLSMSVLQLTYCCRYLEEAPMKIVVVTEEIIYYVHPGVVEAYGKFATTFRMSGLWKGTGDGTFDWTGFKGDGRKILVP